MLTQPGHRRLEPGACRRPVLHHPAGKRLGLVGVSGQLAVAVHVHRQGHEAERRELLGPGTGIAVQPPPFVHHQDRRLWLVDAGIACQVALVGGAAGGILEELTDHARPGLGRERRLGGRGVALGLNADCARHQACGQACQGE